MSLKSVCPMIATDRLAETRAFYDWLGFDVDCVDPRSLQVAWADDPDLRIGFQAPADDAEPEIFRDRFAGAGVVLRFEVMDVETLYRRIGAVYTLAVKLRDDRCGRRHFAIVDPNGLVLEFVGERRPRVGRGNRSSDVARLSPMIGAHAVPYPQTVQPMIAG